MNNGSRGIIYVATGAEYIKEALISAHSAKLTMPDIGITIYCDVIPDGDLTCFNQIELLEEPCYSYIDKIEPLLRSPYDTTLFLDSDTFLLDDVYEVYQVLDKFDLAYVHSPVRISPWVNKLDIPICFPEANTGVIAYKKNEKTISLFENWLEIYKKQLKMEIPPNHDQPSFRLALYQSDVISTVLPSEYNLRTIVPCSKGRAKVKILHGREPTLSRAISEINEIEGISIFDFRV